MKVKSIIFKTDLIGNGIVNMDSNEQKFIFNGTDSHLKSFHRNTSYSKKNFYRDEEGNLTYKIKISSDCLKNAMFKNDVISQSPKITHEDAVLYSYIASPMSLIRGYMFANKTETLKRSGAFNICDAEQTCNSVSYMETFSKSGEKITNDVDSDKSDNSFYKKETIGNISYSTIGSIDLMGLQFVSADQVFDRYSLNPDKFSIYKSFLKLRLNNFNSELGYYGIKNTVLDIPEFGFKLSDENVIELVKETLKRMLLINIKRKGAFANVSSLKIKLVYDPLVDTMSSKDNWIEIKTQEDIDNLSFEVEDFYTEVNTENAKKLRADIEKAFKEEQLKSKKEKKEKDNE